jgi:hypothetical protein
LAAVGDNWIVDIFEAVDGGFSAYVGIHIRLEDTDILL